MPKTSVAGWKRDSDKLRRRKKSAPGQGKTGGRCSAGAPRSAVSTSDMTIKGKAYIAGIFEHPTRKADDMGLKVRHIDTTESGGSSYVIHARSSPASATSR
jgi:hypothetical protein